MTLADRFASAGPEDQRELLMELATHYPDQHAPDEKRYWAWREWNDPFNLLLNIGTDPAFLAAAMMLAPDRCFWAVGSDGWASIVMQGSAMFRVVEASTPALALGAAIARSMRL